MPPPTAAPFGAAPVAAAAWACRSGSGGVKNGSALAGVSSSVSVTSLSGKPPPSASTARWMERA